ncbi:MAG TPA: DUF1059 domain-containing protein [Candidatus Nitrosotalea sp.]|nr:DUF1059 domain-containing protein [Candidatus Nitrosotalea sp.]
MNKIFKCADISFKCDWVAKAKTENEFIVLIKDHTAKCHDLKEITKDIDVKVKSVIRDQ